MKLLFVGGNFDNDGGRPSSLVKKFSNEIKQHENIKLTVYNGGHFSEIEHILNQSIHYDTVLWWANIPNHLPKIRNIKEINPKCMLVTSKRNNNEYTFSELINRALGAKANLCVEFSKQKDKYKMLLFDPLGNNWYEGTDITECCDKLIHRLTFLKDITRQNCNHMSDSKLTVPNEKEFFNLIKEYAETFHTLIAPAKDVTRFLGNSSFRCQRGFPSFRKNNIIYVSKRNIDKRFIDKDGFVPTILSDNKIMYYGNYKPSVDTPIQLRLYNQLPKINYMIHAHVYIQDAPFTGQMIPCGGLEEINEVLSTIQDNYESYDEDFYAINLIGHGCIVMSSDVEKLKNLEYISRPIPEKIKMTEDYIQTEEIELD